ncbi:hypothetical protein H4R20_006488, partial [Coemansia guatemalensis]
MGPVSSRAVANVVSEPEDSSASASPANEPESENNSSRADSSASSEEEEEEDASDDEHNINVVINGNRHATRKAGTAGRSRRSIMEESELESIANTATPPPPEPAADASDEEFAQPGSESDADEGEETDGLVIRPRRVSARHNGNSPSHSRWRLRRLRQGRQDDAESPTPHSAGQQQRRLRRLQNVADNSQLGYASSPTASRRQRRHGHADNLHTTPRRRLLPQQLLAEDGDNSSATDGQNLGIESRQHSAAQTSPVARKRKIAPALLTTTLADSNDTESAQQEMVISSPPVIDKPREERSYKEFFPDLNVHMPLTVQMVRSPCSQSDGSATDTQLADIAAKDSVETLLPAAPATPVSSASSQGGGSTIEQSGNSAPEQSRTSSSLSIKLVFNDPGVPAPPPALRTGKSANSYTGTPQSSVVVLAPKRPVVALPAAESRQLATAQRARFLAQTGFKRPRGHYIRNVELTEKDLAKRVEYDLDEVDREWLQKLNQGRSSHGQGEVSAEALEKIIDHIEK